MLSSISCPGSVEERLEAAEVLQKWCGNNHQLLAEGMEFENGDMGRTLPRRCMNVS